MFEHPAISAKFNHPCVANSSSTLKASLIRTVAVLIIDTERERRSTSRVSCLMTELLSAWLCKIQVYVRHTLQDVFWPGGLLRVHCTSVLDLPSAPDIISWEVISIFLGFWTEFFHAKQRRLMLCISTLCASLLWISINAASNIIMEQTCFPKEVFPRVFEPWSLPTETLTRSDGIPTTGSSVGTFICGSQHIAGTIWNEKVLCRHRCITVHHDRDLRCCPFGCVSEFNHYDAPSRNFFSVLWFPFEKGFVLIRLLLRNW